MLIKWLYFILGMIFVLHGCRPAEETPPLTDAPGVLTEMAQTPKPVVYFGVISRYHPVVMYEEYLPIMHYLTAQTPYRFELKLGKNYEEAVSDLEKGVTQIASLGAVTYVEAHSRFGALPIVRPLNEHGEPFYRSVIIVRNDSDIQRLTDLRGRSFAFASLHSTSGNLFGRSVLAEAGIDLQNLDRYHNFQHHDQVVKAVLSGEFDAGSVKDVVAFKYQSKGLRLLHFSEPIPSVPFVVRPDASNDFVKAVKNALLQIDPSRSEYTALTANWNEEFKYGFIETSVGDYEPIRKMLNAIPER